MKKQLYKFLFFKLMGWKIIGIENAEVKKCVMMVMPHTSNHDFYLGIFTRGISALEMNWVGKKELFKFPFGYYFRSVGGEPLDRSGGLNKVDAIVSIFEKKEVFRLAVAPEGTRKEVKEIRSGFYYIALKANVPIIPVAFDWGKKEVNFGKAFSPSGNYDADLQILKNHYNGVIGRIHEKGFQL